MPYELLDETLPLAGLHGWTENENTKIRSYEDEKFRKGIPT